MKQKSVLIYFIVIAGLLTPALNGSLFAETTPLVKAKNVVVTATRSEMDTKDAPGAITIITRQDIEETDAADLVGLLREHAGVVLKGRSVGGRKTITFRGFNDKHTLMLVDGMRISASNAAIGHSDMENNWVPIESIERIEIVRGPLSALYGSEAMGGVVNIITKKTGDKWHGSVQTRAGFRDDGNDGEIQNFGAQVSGPVIKDKLGIRVSAEYSNEEVTPDKDDEKQTDIEGKEVTSGSVGLTYTPSSDHTLNIFFNGANDERERPALSRGKYFTDYYDIDKYQVGAELSSKIGFTDNVLKLYRSSITKDKDKIYESGKTSNSYDKIVNEVADFQSSFLIMGSRLTLGGEFRKEELTSPTMVEKSDDAVHTALFAQDEIVLFDRLSITTGLRFDHHDAFGSEISPRIYALYKINDNINLKAGYGHAFNAPTIKQVSDGYQANTGPHTFFGNPDIKPETSDNYEVGLELYFDRIQAKAFYFHNEIDDLIDWDLIRKIGRRRQFKAENIDEARTRGLETQIGVDLPFNFHLSANYMYLDAKDTKNNERLEDRPRHTMGGKLRYDFEPWGLWAALRFDYTGSQLINEENAPPFTLWSFSMGKQITSSLDLKCGIDNIGDVRLADESDAFNYEERGRTFWAGLTAKF